MTTPPRRDSRWHQQLGALGFDPVAAATPAARREAARAAALHLLPLTLPAAAPAAHGPFARRGVARGAGACLSLLVLVGVGVGLFHRSRGPDLQPKGGTLVQVWRERGGAVRPLPDGDPVRAGDRLRVEIHASAAGAAFWTAVDAARHSLVDASFVLASRTALVADQTASLPTSLRIDGDDVGETLLVLLCGDPAPEPPQIERWVPGIGRPVDAPPAGCEMRTFKLR